MILQKALRRSKPGKVLSSGFRPLFDQDRCVSCETCIDNCPTTALMLGENDVPQVNLDRCIGCGVCATGCPSEAIVMETKIGAVAPPVDQKALRAALKASTG